MIPKSFDQTDSSILQILLEDSRIPQKQISKKLNLPLSTLIKRIKEMRRDTIEKFTIIVDPRKLGLGIYLLRISTDVSNLKPLLGRIHKEEYVTDVHYNEDGEIFIKAICSEEKFKIFYEKIIGGFADKIKKFVLLTQPSIKKHTPIIHVSEIIDLKKKADRKKKTDLSILQLLLEDSRSTQSSMAKRLGIPLSTFQKKLNKLSDKIIDKYTVVVDPRKVGLDTYMTHITIANLLEINNILEMMGEEKCVSEVFHREDGEILIKSICSPEDFIDFYARLHDSFGEHIENVVLVPRPNVVKHASVIPPSLLEKVELNV